MRSGFPVGDGSVLTEWWAPTPRFGETVTCSALCPVKSQHKPRSDLGKGDLGERRQREKSKKPSKEGVWVGRGAAEGAVKSVLGVSGREGNVGTQHPLISSCPVSLWYFVVGTLISLVFPP